VRYVRSADAKGTASRAHAGFRLFASRKKAVVGGESLLVGFRLVEIRFRGEKFPMSARVLETSHRSNQNQL
jgi:hypothetical protein